MYTLTCCVSVFPWLCTAYNLFIRFRESFNPGYTIHGISRTARVQWVASILEKNGILADANPAQRHHGLYLHGLHKRFAGRGRALPAGNGENVRHMALAGLFWFCGAGHHLPSGSCPFADFLAFFALPHRSGWLHVKPSCWARNPVETGFRPAWQHGKKNT